MIEMHERGSARQALGWSLVMGAVALVAGAALGLAPPSRVLLGLAVLAPLPFILHDYRVGVVLLALVLPVLPMLPSVSGLNPANYLVLASWLGFAARRWRLGPPGPGVAALPVVPLPALLWLCFALPVAVGMVVAWPHIGEGVRNYPTLADAQREFHPPTYLVDRFVKPLLYFFSFAFLLANAVRDSRHPERFIAVLALSAVVPALAVFWTVARYPGSLAELARDREFMAPRGMHANEFGLLLALLCGPLLFVAGDAGRGRWRVLALGTLALVVPALLLTFSRGGLLAALIAFAGFLWHQRRLKTLVLSAALAGLVLLAAPEELQERFATGLRAGALTDTQRVDRDDLTAGRVNGWLLLAPEVLDSPWIGSGLGSTQWSSAVAAGRYKANHPHNIYLEVLMDLGLLGLAAMVLLHAQYLRRLRRLAGDEALSPLLRSFFLGARWSLWGGLAMAATTAFYMPNPAQAPWWFCLGLLFAYWAQAAAPARAPARTAAR
ncbi:MAG: O-antigen ligase family protein [Rubrivivax sp.]